MNNSINNSINCSKNLINHIISGQIWSNQVFIYFALSLVFAMLISIIKIITENKPTLYFMVIIFYNNKNFIIYGLCTIYFILMLVCNVGLVYAQGWDIEDYQLELNNINYAKSALTKPESEWSQEEFSAAQDYKDIGKFNENGLKEEESTNKSNLKDLLKEKNKTYTDQSSLSKRKTEDLQQGSFKQR